MSIISLNEKRKRNEENKSVKESVAHIEDRQRGSKLRVTGVYRKDATA